MLRKNKIIAVVVLVFLFVLLFSLAYPKYANFLIANFKPVPLLRAIPQIPEKPFKLGLDLIGGSHLVYEADLSAIQVEDKQEAMAGLRDVIERRVNSFGVAEPQVQVQEISNSFRLVVDLAGISDIKEAINQIGKTPYLEFKQQRPEQETQDILKQQEEYKNKTEEDLKTEEEKIAKYNIENTDPYFVATPLTGRYLKSAQLGFDQTSSQALVLIEFDEEGAELFKQITSENIGKPLAIFIDNVLISAPMVNETIPSGKAQISGGFTVEQAKDLARNLSAGALPVPIKIIAQDTVGPSLGRVSLDKSLQAALFGAFAVLLFMLCFYRFNGFLAGISLLYYCLILLCLFKFVPITLTLAGIGGAILSVGMAVDANVLIFERFKEERKAGNSFSKAIDEAFKRAWPSVRDSNLTTLLIALIMFSFGASFVKGFALTLSLGILVSMLSAMAITRILMQLFAGTKLERIM